MAERVQENLEKFSSYISQLVRLKIVKRSESLKILKEREKFEYGICKRVANRKDFKRYIKYEIFLFKTLNKKIEKCTKDSNLSLPHQKIIHGLFRRALTKFKDEIKFWMIHFQFCIDTNNIPIFESSISNFIRLHFSNIQCWTIAVNFYTKVDKDISYKLLLKALKMFHNSVDLNFILFKMEISNNIHNNNIYDKNNINIKEKNISNNINDNNIYDNNINNLNMEEEISFGSKNINNINDKHKINNINIGEKQEISLGNKNMNNYKEKKSMEIVLDYTGEDVYEETINKNKDTVNNYYDNDGKITRNLNEILDENTLENIDGIIEENRDGIIDENSNLSKEGKYNEDLDEFSNISKSNEEISKLILKIFKNCKSIEFLNQCLQFLSNKQNFNSLLLQLFSTFEDDFKLNSDKIFISALILIAFRYLDFDEYFTFNKCKLLISQDNFSEIIDYLLQKRYSVELINQWCELLTKFILNKCKSTSLIAKTLDFYVAFEICINEEFKEMVLRSRDWNCIEKYLKCVKFNSFDDFLKFYDETLSKYPDNRVIIIDRLSERLEEFNNKEYFMKCFKYIKKNYILCLFKFVENLFGFITINFSYSGLKKMIIKNIKKCIPSLNLLLKIKDMEFKRDKIDFDFLRSVFDSYIQLNRENEVEFWLAYTQIESSAIRVSLDFETRYLTQVYNRAIKNLTGENVQDFISKYNLLEI